MKFYTYMWLREDGTPYYVGKGSGNRAFKKRFRRIGYPPPMERIIIQHHSSELAAFESEKALILFYGRKDLGTGCLANLTCGGDNPPNHKGTKRSPEWIRKHSELKRGRQGKPQTPETRNKRRLAMLGRTFSAESILKMRLAQLGKTHFIKRPVRQIDSSIIHDSVRGAARIYGLQSSHITKCCQGLSQTAGGFHWEYV